MLEYLLLRPADIDLFEGTAATGLRLADEAHVYDKSPCCSAAPLNRVAEGRALRCITTQRKLRWR